LHSEPRVPEPVPIGIPIESRYGDPVINGPVTIIVEAIANLCGPGIYCSVAIVTIRRTCNKAFRRAAGILENQFVPKPVAIGIPVIATGLRHSHSFGDYDGATSL
jgi:hypothetical protein